MKKTTNKRKKLTKLLIVFAVAIAVILLTSLNFLHSKNDKVVAKVNGRNIYKSEVEERLSDVFKNTDASVLQVEKLPNEVMEILVKDIFVQKELDKRAKRYRIIKSKETREKIRKFTKKITRKEYLDSVIAKKVSEAVVRDKYVEMVNELSGKKEIHLRHILVKSEAEAKGIIAKLNSKQSFEELAKKYSLDNITAAEGGDLGYVIEGSLTKEFSDVVESMKPNSFSKPIKTEFGWHIIKVEDSREAEVVPFDSIKEDIREELKEQEIKNIFAEIMDDAKIEILIKPKEDEDVVGQPESDS